jgi:hypothetical protein
MKASDSKMYKIGFKFEVVKFGIIGIIDGVSTPGIYSVAFFDYYGFYCRRSVYEGTIIDNLKIGAYKEIKEN